VADKRLILCPYCGNTQNEPEDRCAACGGYFDSLSLKVTQEHMGPWFVRDRHNPFRPGMSYAVLKREIEKGRIRPTTIIKGPTTRQFWSVARNVPGVAHLVGYCHACGAHVKPDDDNCSECGEVFFAPKLRDNLGLAPMGADVQAKSKLSADGAYAGGTQAPQAPTSAAAGLASPEASPPPPTTDQPVGSSILAGLRSDAPSGDEAAAVGEATSKANASRNAMAWMTPGANEEPDTLQTAGDATAPLPRQSSTLTWILIAVNVALLTAIGIAAFLFVLNRDPSVASPPRPDAGADPATEIEQPDPPDGPDTGPGGDEPVELADPMDTGFGDDDADGPTEAATEVDPNTEARQRWAEAFERALRLEEDGRLADALNTLTTIRDDAPVDVQPPGLNAAIDRVNRKIKKAELDALFE